VDRLSNTTLHHCRAAVPPYIRSDVGPTIVHLGLGAFARAHLCVTLDDLITAGTSDLGVVGVSLRHRDVPDALAPQDGLYTVGVIDGDSLTTRIVGSVVSVLHAPTQPELVREAMASSSTSMVTVTVTEKGYCWEPATRRLDRGHPDVIHDLAHPTQPRTVLGHLALAARDRRHSGAGGLTVLSLDNIPANGTTLASLLREFVAPTDQPLATWIDDHLAFPCSMVDRMVPATDDTFREAVAVSIGLEDAWPVRAEPFSQWVVERSWATPMPPLASVGVHVVDDVAPWESLKLRVLNALHTVAAHHGLRHGLDTVDAVAADPAGRHLLSRVADEIREVLIPPEGVDVDAYIERTLARFANSGLRHRCAQIATDSSQKLPQRLLVTLAERSSRALPSEAILDAIALWAWSTLGVDDQGDTRVVNDPLAHEYATIAAAAAGDEFQLARRLVELRSVFGTMAGDAQLTDAIADRLASLMS
jgi:fructuronate reductase